MSELPAQLIRKYALEQGMVTPFCERGLVFGKTYGLGPSTYDFRIAQRTVIMPPRMYWRWRLYKFIDWVRYEVFNMPRMFDRYFCGFALCSTIEKIAVPQHISATPMDKSTWARMGITVQNTHFDPGFIGFPTIELTNHSNEIVDIPEGVAICQFKFSFLAEPTEMPYQGRYQNQPARPVEAKEGMDVWK